MYYSPLLKSQKGIVHAFSDASDGNLDLRFGEHEAVLKNRRLFLGHVGLNMSDCVQQHGLEDLVHVVKRSELGRGMTDIESRIHANAFITSEAGVGLFLCVADCLPIIMFDPTKRVIALLHAARESTNRKLAEQVVERLKSEFDCSAADILVAFGPAVRAQSYVFDSGIHKLVGPEWGPYLHETKPGSFEVDYVAYNRDQLLRSGVTPEHIQDPNIDTGSDPGYFSHVQSIRTGRPEARLGAVVSLLPA